jgi:hypothetical protein
LARPDRLGKAGQMGKGECPAQVAGRSAGIPVRVVLDGYSGVARTTFGVGWVRRKYQMGEIFGSVRLFRSVRMTGKDAKDANVLSHASLGDFGEGGNW